MRAADFFRNADIAGGRLTIAVQRRINQVGHWLLEFRGYEEQKRRLQHLIEVGWETLFNVGIEDPLIDETACALAKGAPEMGDSGAYKPVEVSCTLANPPECGIETFWHNHRIQLEVLANMDIGSIKVENKDTKELETVKEHASQMLIDKKMYGRRCTVRLSDAIICIESTHCPEECAVHSTNKKHFAPLGEVLGVETEPK